MSGFSAGWLALREPADAAARSASLARQAAAIAAAKTPVRAIDLATGTGSNVRYLAPLLPPDQEWLLADEDERLLHLLPGRLPGRRFEARRVNLAQLDALDVIEGRTLVTASALIDLVSEPWLDALASRAARAGAVVLFALSYNGHIECWPGEPEDDMVRRLVNRHQRTDKGFGPALGPDAVACAASHFTRRGYHVARESSDWVLSGEQGELQRQLIDGWADAAVEIAPSCAPAVTGWKARRLAHIAASRSSLIVGHDDLLAHAES